MAPCRRGGMTFDLCRLRLPCAHHGANDKMSSLFWVEGKLNRRSEERRGEDRRIGSILRRLREGLGLSVREAAERLRIPKSLLDRIEKGKSGIAASRVLEICIGYEVSPNDLFGWPGC